MEPTRLLAPSEYVWHHEHRTSPAKPHSRGAPPIGRRGGGLYRRGLDRDRSGERPKLRLPQRPFRRRGDNLSGSRPGEAPSGPRLASAAAKGEASQGGARRGRRTRHEAESTGLQVPTAPSRQEAQAAIATMPVPEKRKRHKEGAHGTASSAPSPEYEKPPTSASTPIHERHISATVDAAAA